MAAGEQGGSVFDGASPRLFSIDAGRPFLSDLADGLIAALGDRLSAAEIFLPTRRGVRAAADAFLDAYERCGVRAALLPRFRAIGDIDEDELLLFSVADEMALPPAISPAERLIGLARLVAAKDRAFAGHEHWPAAVAASRELGKLLDSFYTEEVDPKALSTLKVDDAAGHWRRSLEFLEIVTAAWPAHLSEIDRSDPADRRAKLIKATARRFTEFPPSHPLIIAGTTASAPAVADLVRAVAAAPVGAVVLPGLDRTLDARGWESIDDAHPQAGLKTLLDRLGVAPAGVAPWPKSGERSPRASLLTLALRPAAATDEWLALTRDATKDDPYLAAASAGLSLIEADNEEAEATVIASLLRMAVEHPDETAILVTPDRNLARRVALKMRRWNIDVDDSAGVPFANTPCGTFLRLVALWVEAPDDPVLTLAMLRHPLARLGMDYPDRAYAVDALDRELRSRRNVTTALCEAAERANEERKSALGALAGALDGAAALFPREPNADFPAQFSGHVAAAERLAGGERLWAGEDGEKGAELLAELLRPAKVITLSGERRYADVFSALIADAAVRARTEPHPRLAILGPLEARLQSADHIILGGLNEGVWPAGAANDAFLSRPMRKDLGLPSPERRIGLAAHDFAQLAAQPRVTLSRAKRSGGKPAEPSRWMIRLKNILTGAKALGTVDQSQFWRRVVAELDDAGTPAPAKRPAPPAGPGRRPHKISVTDVGKWLRDPYAIYAGRLLGLRKLDEPGEPFGAREMGALLHKVLERAALEIVAPTLKRLRSIFDEEAAARDLGASDRRFWSAAIEESFAWYIAFDAERRAAGTLGAVECAGEWTMPGVEPPFTLTARADRVDILADGQAAVFDYKSGRVHSRKQDEVFALQLPLTAAVLEAGGFPTLGALSVGRYEYARIANRDGGGGDGWWCVGPEARDAIREAADRLAAWIAKFDDARTPYLSQPRPEFIDQYGDYDQLARRKEWSAMEEDDE